MSTFFSADICLARVLANYKRARAYVLDAGRRRKWLPPPQALGWEHGASEKRKSWRQASSARLGDDDGNVSLFSVDRRRAKRETRKWRLSSLSRAHVHSPY